MSHSRPLRQYLLTCNMLEFFLKFADHLDLIVWETPYCAWHWRRDEAGDIKMKPADFIERLI